MSSEETLCYSMDEEEEGRAPSPPPLQLGGADADKEIEGGPGAPPQEGEDHHPHLPQQLGEQAIG